MNSDPADLLLPQGMLGAEGKVPLRLHPIERELHALTSAAGRMANALEKIAPKLEGIAKDIAVLRSLVEREAATDHANRAGDSPRPNLSGRGSGPAIA